MDGAWASELDGGIAQRNDKGGSKDGANTARINERGCAYNMQRAPC